MKHARADYDRIQDPAGRIPDKEPVFLLRAQDATSPETVEFWIEQQVARDGDPQLIELARDHVQAMRDWQREHGSKTADAGRVSPRRKRAVFYLGVAFAILNLAYGLRSESQLMVVLGLIGATASAFAAWLEWKLAQSPRQ